jgi:xanthine dehydrogenase accessory factor
MIKAIATWKLIEQSLAEDIPVMLLYVLQSEGSSPGRKGFFMAVNEKEEMSGSIGGGIMEHKFVEMARERLKEQGTRSKIQGTRSKAQVRKQYHNKLAAANQSGMICSGEQTILLYPVQKKERNVISNVISSLEKNQNGTLTLSPGGIDFENKTPEQNFYYSFQSGSDWIYREKTGYKNYLHIVGGGHCALALSKLISSLDFYMHVYDDRKELNTMLQNEAAHEKHFVNDYTSLKELIPSGKDHYVVIMTMGYRSDDIAIRALLEKRFSYMGVLGSRSKMEKMMNEYKNEDFKEEWLQRIHAPAGLEIKSQTPEEIAVSIAAEIIKKKNANRH